MVVQQGDFSKFTKFIIVHHTLRVPAYAPAFPSPTYRFNMEVKEVTAPPLCALTLSQVEIADMLD